MAALWIIGIVCAFIFIGAFIQGWNKPQKQEVVRSVAPKCNNEKSKVGNNIIVHIDEFYKHHTISIPLNILDKMDEAIMRGEEYIEIPEHILRTIDETTAKRKVEERRLHACCIRNNNGIMLEKNGAIDAAISEYEENIKEGYPALHSYNRLMVLYRKRKEYENEIRVIDYAMGVFSADDRYAQEIDKWRERRIKAEQLKKKTN